MLGVEFHTSRLLFPSPFGFIFTLTSRLSLASCAAKIGKPASAYSISPEQYGSDVESGTPAASFSAAPRAATPIHGGAASLNPGRTATPPVELQRSMTVGEAMRPYRPRAASWIEPAGGGADSDEDVPVDSLSTDASARADSAGGRQAAGGAGDAGGAGGAGGSSATQCRGSPSLSAGVFASDDPLNERSLTPEKGKCSSSSNGVGGAGGHFKPDVRSFSKGSRTGSVGGDSRTMSKGSGALAAVRAAALEKKAAVAAQVRALSKGSMGGGSGSDAIPPCIAAAPGHGVASKQPGGGGSSSDIANGGVVCGVPVVAQPTSILPVPGGGSPHRRRRHHHHHHASGVANADGGGGGGCKCADAPGEGRRRKHRHRSPNGNGAAGGGEAASAASPDGESVTHSRHRHRHRHSTLDAATAAASATSSAAIKFAGSSAPISPEAGESSSHIRHRHRHRHKSLDKAGGGNAPDTGGDTNSSAEAPTPGAIRPTPGNASAEERANRRAEALAEASVHEGIEPGRRRKHRSGGGNLQGTTEAPPSRLKKSAAGEGSFSGSSADLARSGGSSAALGGGDVAASGGEQQQQSHKRRHKHRSSKEGFGEDNPLAA